MANRKPRYEYRVWGEWLESLKDKLERLANKVIAATVSEEFYLISSRTDECNAKVRAGLLNLKVLLATDRELELWQPVLDAGFPLARSVIQERLFPALRLDRPSLQRPQYPLDDFFAQVVRPHRELKSAKTLKTRTLFQMDQCRAEFTSVTIGNSAYQTIAVESAQPDRVFGLVRELKLLSLPNTSYVRQLKKILRDNPNLSSYAVDL